MRVRAVDLHGGTVDAVHLGAEPLENREEHFHIADLRNVFQTADALHEEDRRYDCNGSVFRAADRNFAMQRSTAADHIFIHLTPLACFLRNIYLKNSYNRTYYTHLKDTP